MVQTEKSGIYLDSLMCPEISDEDIRKVRLLVASNALGVEDCRLLLEVLGLEFDS
jgi:hypothetical protein